MNDQQIWFGFLDAGNKGTPVVLDRSLSTGNDRTLYLYNLARRAFVEYDRAIVEPKLRDLAAGECDALPELEQAFIAARQGFGPPRRGSLEQAARSSARRAAEESVEEGDGEEPVDELIGAEVGLDDGDDSGDEDWDEDND